MIRLALRFDDPSATSNHELETAIFERLEHYKIPITVAVIPYRRQANEYLALTSSNAAHLIEAHREGILEIAQHGYSHEARSRTTSGKPSEFAGVAAKEQDRLISAGHTLLVNLFEGDITGFVPPYNTYDAITVSTLSHLGFRYLSAGFEFPNGPRSFIQLPRSSQMVDIKMAVEEARRYAWLRPVIIGVMHHYDFLETGSPQARIDLNGFMDRLAWIAAQRDVKMLTLGEMSRAYRNFSQFSQLESLRRVLPWRLHTWLPQKCLLPVPHTSLSFH